MTSFYEITPLDTLFFRGSTPMEAGQYNTLSLFPPPASVLQGALWTAWCRNKGKSFSEGLTEGRIPIELKAFLIKKVSGNKSACYAPAPATWYYDADDKASKGTDCDGRSLCIAQDKEEVFAALNMQSSAGNVVFAVPEIDAKPLGGAWINVDFLKKPREKFANDSVLLAADIYGSEPRTGIGLTADKKAENGKLYTSTHIRMKEAISFVVGCECNFEMPEGKILIGGEQRIAELKKCSDIPQGLLQKDDWSHQYLSLVPIKATKENLDALVASAKLMVTSGWDMAKGFHKPSVSWIPAGAVFSQNINDSCIPLGTK